MNAFAVSSPMNHGSLSTVGSGATQIGVSALEYAKSYALHRYGPRIFNAFGQRADDIVDKAAEHISGRRASKTKGSTSGSAPSSVQPTDKGSNNSSSNGKPPGGRRASKASKGDLGPGGAPDVSGVPQLTLDSGIESGVILNPLQDTTSTYSPMFIQCGQLFPDITSQNDSSYAKLAGKELFYKYLMIVQSEVNYSLVRQFTEENFYSYITKICTALQLYYMIDSILSFTSHAPNYNIAMTKLRMAITPDIANGHIKLKDFLQTTPIPPNLLVYIRHMYQNYKFSDVVGSPIIRLSLNNSLCTSEYKGALGIDGSDYSRVLSSLIDSSECSSIIKKIRNNWVNSMQPSSYEALFDPQFSTFWHNSNIAYEDFGSKAIKHTINTKTVYDPLYYGIFSNRLDGLIYASCSVRTENDVIEMGLWKPFAGFAIMNSTNSSLLHYSNDGLMRPVTEREMRVCSMVHSAPHTVVTPDKNLVWDVISASYLGACIPQVHTLENVRQAITRSVYWLLDPN